MLTRHKREEIVDAGGSDVGIARIVIAGGKTNYEDTTGTVHDPLTITPKVQGDNSAPPGGQAIP